MALNGYLYANNKLQNRKEEEGGQNKNNAQHDRYVSSIAIADLTAKLGVSIGGDTSTKESSIEKFHKVYCTLKGKSFGKLS